MVAVLSSHLALSSAVLDSIGTMKSTRHYAEKIKSSWWTFVIVLVALFLSRGVVTLCIFPPLEGWDEYQHVAYIQYLIDHQATPVARASQTVVSESLLEALTRFPQPEHMLEQKTGGLGYGVYWEDQQGSVFRGDRAAPAPALYQAQHGSLYYRLVEPVYTWFGGSADLRSSIAALRVLNLIFAASALAFVLASLGRLLSPLDARIVGLLVSLQPLFLLNSVRVANDSLAILLSSIVVAAVLHPRAQHSLLVSIVVGVTAGCAALVKAFGLVLVPFLGVSYFVSVLTGDLKWRRAALCGCLSMVFASLLIVPALIGNVETYGSLTPMQEGLVNRQAGRGFGQLLETALAIDWPRRLGWMWLYGNTWVGGWSFISTGSTLRRVVSITLMIMSAGWVWSWILPKARRSKVFTVPGTGLRLIAVVILMSAALGYHMIHSLAAWGVISTNPWYAAFAFPWALTLVYGGALQWPTRAFGMSLAALLIILYFAAEVNGTFFRMLPFYSNTMGPLSLERMAALRPEVLGTSTLYLASLMSLFLLGTLVWLAGRGRSGGAAMRSRD